MTWSCSYLTLNGESELSGASALLACCQRLNGTSNGETNSKAVCSLPGNAFTDTDGLYSCLNSDLLEWKCTNDTGGTCAGGGLNRVCADGPIKVEARAAKLEVSKAVGIALVVIVLASMVVA